MPTKLFAELFSFPRRRCYSLFGLQNIIAEENATKLPVRVVAVPKERHAEVVALVKREYFPHHPLVRARRCRAFADSPVLAEYVLSLLERGDSLCAVTKAGELVGASVNVASRRDDIQALEAFAAYRQDSDLKEILYFTTQLQLTPDLWKYFKEENIFEVKMLVVAEAQRRRGAGGELARGAVDLARRRRCTIMRMDCGNYIGCKIAEKCDMLCLHKMRLSELCTQDGGRFVRREDPRDRLLHVYVDYLRRDKTHDWLKRCEARADTAD